MCPNHSVSLPQGLVSFRTTAPASGAPKTPAGPPPPPGAGLPAAELKAIQQKAFERGREFERGKVAERFRDLIVALDAARRQFADEREKDQAATARFGVEVAIGVTRELVGEALAEGRIDVRAMAEAAIREAFPVPGDGPTRVRLHPDDAAALREIVGDRPIPDRPDVVVEADPAAERGTCRVTSSGAEIFAGVEERLRRVEERLRETAKRDAARA